ncbi:gp228 [Sphingomonas phage PAU]|uniref:gp228 n=1 Tax=Sphingomonas phage PAU TaxID=1150991 RepID=UPI0002573382|nr:gp228 [Sphingomonas phage PAU]AFF28226.1 gp228 [Sphingomonas phage PAU]
MKSVNWYDFGAMEVNPPANRRTEHGFRSYDFRAPKRNDKKNWKKFLLWFLTFREENVVRFKDVMKLYGVTLENVERERKSSYNRIKRNNVEARRLNKRIRTPETAAKLDIEFQYHSYRLDWMKENPKKNDKAIKKLKTKCERLNSPSRRKRIQKILES